MTESPHSGAFAFSYRGMIVAALKLAISQEGLLLLFFERQIWIFMFLIFPFTALAVTDNVCTDLFQKSEIQNIESALSPLPHLQLILITLLGRSKANYVHRILNHAFLRDPVHLVNLTEDVRRAIQMDARVRAYAGNRKNLRVLKMPSGKSTFNESVQLIDNPEYFHTDQINLFVRDADPLQRRESELLNSVHSIESLVHEAAHARFYDFLDRIAEILSHRMPINLFRKENDFYLMHPHLYNFLHEWYAHRSAYAAVLTYLESEGYQSPFYRKSYICYRDNLEVPIEIRWDNVDEIAKEVALQSYGIDDAEVMQYIQGKSFEQIIYGNAQRP